MMEERADEGLRTRQTPRAVDSVHTGRGAIHDDRRLYDRLAARAAADAEA